MRNRTPFLLCLIGGILLIAVDYIDGISTIVLIYMFVHALGFLAPLYLIIDIVLLILFLIAWAGGIAIILGGYLLTTTHVRTGKFLITIASGFGLISLIIMIYHAYIVGGLLGLLVLGWVFLRFAKFLGLLLTIIARNKAKY